jgi:hypothetical protein
MVKFYESLNEKERVRFETNLESAARKPGQKDADYFGSESTDAVLMIFHYVEALFLRFDKNEDGFIDQSEAGSAFPIFQTMLAEKSDMERTDKKVKSVFNWLLAKGYSPPRSFWKSAPFIWWHWTKPDYKADRLNLVSVFATLSQVTATPEPPKKAQP